ncbi:hypothetical protein D5086_009423 [Populus alba]|uniref:Uncharacterized protein n=1 Tax=Populus alba TaxID=43335 RepID=A0ACC4CJU7_POPAL
MSQTQLEKKQCPEFQLDGADYARAHVRAGELSVPPDPNPLLQQSVLTLQSPFKLLVSGLEYIGESVTVRQDAYKYYGDSLNYDGGRDSKLSYLIRDRSKFQLLKWLVHHNLAVRVPCEEQPGMCVQLHVADREIIHGLLVLQCQHVAFDEKASIIDDFLSCA